MVAKSQIVRLILGNDVGIMQRLVRQGLADMEKEFREQGNERFGTQLTDHAVFTVWTIAKTADYLWKIQPSPTIQLTEAQKEKERKLGSELVLHWVLAHLHLSYLSASLRLRKAIEPNVRPTLIEGLRSAVNANALARQILDLRVPQTPRQHVPFKWDDEDEDLLRSSMREISSDDI